MGTTEAQLSAHHPQLPQHLYKNDHYLLSHQFLQNLVMQNLSLILIQPYYHPLSIHPLDGIQIILLLVLQTPHQEVV